MPRTGSYGETPTVTRSPGNDLDAEAAHSAAELGEHFVAGVALHAVEPAAVNRHHGALHIDEIVLAQLLAFLSFQTNIVPHPCSQRQCPSIINQPWRSRCQCAGTQTARARGGRAHRPGAHTYAAPFHM